MAKVIFAIGQSLSDCCRAARTDKAGRRGGVAMRPSEGAKPPRMSAFEPFHLFGQYPQRPVEMCIRDSCKTANP